MSLITRLSLCAFLVVTPASAFAMSVIDADKLAAETIQKVLACDSAACVSKTLNATRSKMNGMPVLKTTSSALSKISKTLKKSCKSGCDDAAIAKVRAEVAARAGKLSKSRHAPDKAFVPLFNPAHFGAQLK